MQKVKQVSTTSKTPATIFMFNLCGEVCRRNLRLFLLSYPIVVTPCDCIGSVWIHDAFPTCDLPISWLHVKFLYPGDVSLPLGGKSVMLPFSAPYRTYSSSPPTSLLSNKILAEQTPLAGYEYVSCSSMMACLHQCNSQSWWNAESPYME